jgi:hypothetical protein
MRHVGINVFASCCMLVRAALADNAPPVTIDFTQPVYGLTGEEFFECESALPPGMPCPEDKKHYLSLGDLAVEGLEAEEPQEDRMLTPLVKFQRDNLARIVFKNPAAQLSHDDIALIKERIGKIFGPAKVGAAWRLLDPTPVSK